MKEINHLREWIVKRRVQAGIIKEREKNEEGERVEYIRMKVREKRDRSPERVDC